MSGAIEQEAANILPALLNVLASAGPPAIPAQVVQFALDATVAVVIEDLGAAAALSAIGKGRFLTLHADGGDVYYAFNKAAAGVIDPAARGYGVTICQRIPSGQSIAFRLPPVDAPGTAATAYRYLLFRTAAGTAVLRGAISSVPQGEDVRALQP
jgi:hypothetical protein